MSTEPPSHLPSSLSHQGVRALCVVEADVSQTKRTVRNGHWWNLSRRYELTVLDVKVVPGSADLKFEVWNEGRRLSSDNSEIEVKWENKLRSPATTLVGSQSSQPNIAVKHYGTNVFQPGSRYVAREYGHQQDTTIRP